MASEARGAQLPQIITTQSAVKSWNSCPRRRWWEFEAGNGTETRGWERTRMAIPLSTGSWSHRIVQGLLGIAAGFDMRGWTNGMGFEAGRVVTNASEVILCAKAGYLNDVETRGLELNAETPLEESWTATEQAALIEAFGWAFQRVRVPALLAEYEIVSIEQEEFTLLSGDVGQASRADAVLRRRSDGLLFVYNFKTAASTSDGRWERSFEVDMQLMTETLAVERRMGEKVWGVVIDAFDKGPRVAIHAETLKERPKDDEPQHEAQRSKLLYGYKLDANPPIQKADYDWEGTTKKGWRKFAVWQEEFPAPSAISIVGRDNPYAGMGPIEYWVNWLPVEVVEAQFHTLEPIMRNDRAVERKVTQIVALERGVRAAREAVEGLTLSSHDVALDVHFPQNERSCFYPGKCACYALCWEPGVAEDPEGSGLYRPRQANHPIEGGD